MSDKAKLALRAVELRDTCGAYASRRFAVKHGVLGLYRLALQLAAGNRVTA